MFRFHNGYGGICVAEAMSLNRLDDPDIGGLVVSVRDRCGLDLLDKALEALGGGASVATIAGLLLQAIELPPVVGSGWLIEVPPHADAPGSVDVPMLVCASPAVADRHDMAVHPGVWAEALATGRPVEHRSLDSLAPDLAADLRGDRHGLAHLRAGHQPRAGCRAALPRRRQPLRRAVHHQRAGLPGPHLLAPGARHRAHPLRPPAPPRRHPRPAHGARQPGLVPRGPDPRRRRARAGPPHDRCCTSTSTGSSPSTTSSVTPPGTPRSSRSRTASSRPGPPGARLARLGGDEFAYLLPGASEADVDGARRPPRRGPVGARSTCRAARSRSA